MIKTSFREFLFESSYFSYKNKFYAQLDGTAMGNPASPIMATLVMNELLETVIPTLPFDFPFLYLYVDDIICAIPANCENLVLNAFNSFHDRLKFTIEKETDYRLPFLDVLVIRDPLTGELITDWYQKPTSSGRILNFKSTHPLSQKVAVIKAMKHRSLSLSDNKFQEKNFLLIRKIAKENNYPTKLVNSILYSTKPTEQDKTPTDDNLTNPLSRKYFKLPLIPGLSGRLVSVLKHENYNLVTYPIKTVSDLYSHIKDTTPKEERSGLVYCIDCNNCDKKYIGETRQKLSNRLKQHKYDCNHVNENKTQKTALATHHFDYGHHFKFNSVKILDTEPNNFKRKFLEMIYIKKYEHQTINFKTDINNLSAIYANLIK